jgi:hypothetical protein
VGWGNYNELRNNKDPNIGVYYRNYSKILSTVIKKAKKWSMTNVSCTPTIK